MKYLHTMVRVSDLDRSLDFYCSKLGLKELRRIENEQGRFTLVFLAAPGDEHARDEQEHDHAHEHEKLALALVHRSDPRVLRDSGEAARTTTREALRISRGSFVNARACSCAALGGRRPRSWPSRAAVGQHEREQDPGHRPECRPEL